MKFNKIFSLSLIIMIISVNNRLSIAESNVSKAKAGIQDYTGESIKYLISPLGRSEYNNLGVVDLEGKKVSLVTFMYKVLIFENIEKIYSDPVSLLPYRIERTLPRFLGKDYITEEYDQEKLIVVIRRYRGKKLIKEQVIKSDYPIQNVILLLFYLRKNPDLKIGWNFTARVPAEFNSEMDLIKLELVSIDEIKIPAGKFQAYHFKSVPDRFEIWINKDIPRVPIKIKIKAVINCSSVMKEYSLHNN